MAGSLRRSVGKFYSQIRALEAVPKMRVTPSFNKQKQYIIRTLRLSDTCDGQSDCAQYTKETVGIFYTQDY